MGDAILIQQMNSDANSKIQIYNQAFDLTNYFWDHTFNDVYGDACGLALSCQTYNNWHFEMSPTLSPGDSSLASDISLWFYAYSTSDIRPIDGLKVVRWSYSGTSFTANGGNWTMAMAAVIYNL